MNIVTGYKTRWAGSSGYTKTTETVLLIEESHVKNLRQTIDLLKEAKITDIKPTDKIYFHKSAEFPRHKFKEIMENPIVRKIDKADYTVIGKQSILGNLSRWYASTYYLDSMGDWVASQLYTGMTSDRFIAPSWNSVDDHVKTVEATEKILGKKVIFDSTLNRLIPREVNLGESLFEKLSKMLSSNDKQTVKVGVEILNNLNYTEYRTEVLMLLNQNFNNIRSYGACYGVLFKSLIDVVSKDCPHWNSGNRLGFSLGLLEGDPKNSTLRKGVEEYLNSVHSLKSGKYSIDIVHDVEIQEQNI